MLNLQRVRDLHDVRWVLFGGTPLQAMTAAMWATFCQECGLVAFTANADGAVVGWAVAESYPERLRILKLEGRPDAEGLLLDRLTRLAGERDVAGVFPVDKPDLLALLEGRGYIRQGRRTFLAQPVYAYRRPTPS